jgi:DNA-binding CsgD family transcriptional regulator
MGLASVMVRRAGVHRMIPLRPFMATLIYSIGMGFAGSCAIAFDSPWAPFLIGGTIIVAGILIAMESVRFGDKTRLAVMKWTTPVMTIAILPMPFVGPAVRFALACVLLMLCFCRSIPNRQAQALRVKQEGFSVGAFAFGRLANVVGALVGWVLAYAAFFSHSASADLAKGIVTVTAAVFVVFGTFVFFDYFPPVRQATPERKGRCEVLAEQYGLSDRQLEVMKLLAKGRDAEYITEALVLSSHTVRSHIYAVYKKLGIHSKQELLDMIEREGSQR